jgi:hypothetical protein
MTPLFSNPAKWASEFAKGFTAPFRAAAKVVKKGGGKKHTLPVKTVKVKKGGKKGK